MSSPDVLLAQFQVLANKYGEPVWMFALDTNGQMWSKQMVPEESDWGEWFECAHPVTRQKKMTAFEQLEAAQERLRKEADHA